MTEARLLDSIYMPGVCFPALDRMSVAFNAVDESALNASDTFIAAAISGHDPKAAMRLWWHVTKVGAECWISINPGEYRTEPPPQPCIIRDVPDGISQVTRRAIVQETIEYCDSVKPINDYERSILLRAKHIMNHNYQRPPVELINELRGAHKLKDRAAYQALIRHIYKIYFETLACPVSIFTKLIILLQLQAYTNSWIEEDWASAPGRFIGPYVAILLRDSKSARCAFEICEFEYDDGQVHIRKALSGSMLQMSRELMFAWHRFFGAFVVLRAALHAGADPKKLPLDPIVVEEAAACTSAGLHRGADFFVKHPEAEATSRLADGDISPKTLIKKARADSDEIWPTFTRHFSRMISAQALTLTGHAPLVREGVRQLTEFRAAGESVNGEFETSWADQALLNAYRALDDTMQAEALATYIAGKFLTRILR